LDGNYKETIPQGLSKVLPLAKKTNIIFNSVPTRFDRFDLKDPASNANQIISSQVTRYPDRKTGKIRMNTGIERLNRDCYTRHGLHLNRRGKTKLCTMWSKLVIDCVSISHSKKNPVLGLFKVLIQVTASHFERKAGIW